MKSWIFSAMTLFIPSAFLDALRAKIMLYLDTQRVKRNGAMLIEDPFRNCDYLFLTEGERRMTACVNRKHTKKVAAVVTASLVGALSLGVAPVAAVADTGIDMQALKPADAFKNGTVAATNGKGEAVTFPAKDDVAFSAGSGEYLLPRASPSRAPPSTSTSAPSAGTPRSSGRRAALLSLSSASAPTRRRLPAARPGRPASTPSPSPT